MVDHSRRVRINPAQPLSIEIIIWTPYVLFPLTLPSPSMGARPVRSLCDRTLRGRPQSGRPGRGLRRVGEAPAEPYPELGEGDGGSLPLPHSAPAVTSTVLLSAVPAKAQDCPGKILVPFRRVRKMDCTRYGRHARAWPAHPRLV